jgi:hypothetical protein
MSEGAEPREALPNSPSEARAETRVRSQAEVEYQKLNEYFERLLRLTLLAIGFVVAVAAAFLWKNVSDVKEQANAAITSTTDSAAREISKIGEDSAAVARAEAQKRIDEAFEKGNVQQMIERATRERVDAAVDREIEKKLVARIKGLQDEIAEMGDVAGAASRLRIGFREGLDSLVKQSGGSDESVRRYARGSLLMIGSDYQTALKKRFPDMSPSQIAGVFSNPQPPPKNLKELLETIRRSDNVDRVAAAFLLMSEMAGTDIKVFDIPAAEKWCAEHRPKCE